MKHGWTGLLVEPNPTIYPLGYEFNADLNVVVVLLFFLIYFISVQFREAAESLGCWDLPGDPAQAPHR